MSKKNTVKISSASRNDNGLGTISIPALSKFMRAYDPETGSWSSLRDLSHGTQISFYVNGTATVFRVNRAGRTVASRALPRNARPTATGRSTNVTVNTRAIVLP